MKTYTVVGVLLILLGVIAFTYQGINYTTRDKAVDLGPIQITTETKRQIPLPPIVGGIALAGGIALLISGRGRQ